MRNVTQCYAKNVNLLKFCKLQRLLKYRCHIGERLYIKRMHRL